jgi:hypothetical protein
MIDHKANMIGQYQYVFPAVRPHNFVSPPVYGGVSQYG